MVVWFVIKIEESNMKKILLSIVTSLILSTPAMTTAGDSQNLDAALQSVVDNYLKGPGVSEHISGVALSVSIPSDNENIRSYFAGKTRSQPSANSIDAQNLFQIGSITKSFTAAIILQLEAEGKLNINQTVGDFLPQYKAWKDVPIKRLLNMTSNIPSYSFNEDFQKILFAHPDKQWTNEELLKYADPSKPIKSMSYRKFEYSNTNYILAGMIAEAVTKQPFVKLMHDRLIKREFGFENTFYTEKTYPESVMRRLVPGYYFDEKKKHWVELIENNISWGKAAGGIVSDTKDIIHWVKVLYLGKLFPQKQLAELMTPVSTKTGKPFSLGKNGTGEGFALGVGVLNSKDVGGRYWFYEGSTMAYRAAYMWKPCNNIVVSAALNSKKGGKEDHIKALLHNAYKEIVAAHPEYMCRD